MISFKKELSTCFYFLVNRFYKLLALIRQAYHTKSCLLCLASTENKHAICNSCSGDLPLNTVCCHQCALPLATQNNSNELICGECLCDEPPFDKTISVFHYAYPVDSCIQSLKYNGRRYFAQTLSSFLIKEIVKRDQNDPLPEVLLPVPIHRKKLKQRGFNQSLLIALELKKALKIPIDQSILAKEVYTESQAGLNKQQRKRNLEKSFTVKKKHTYQHVALIDDVMTTRATAEVIARQLRASGVLTVEVWCIARTPKQ